MKMDRTEMKKVGTITLTVACAIGISSVFLFDNVVTMFPYKASKIITNVKNANVNVESINNYLSINKEEKLKEIKKKVEKAEKKANLLKENSKDMVNPSDVDYGSMLIFLEEKALQNYLQVLNIEFIEENIDSTSNTESNIEDNKDSKDNQETTANQEENIVNYGEIGQYTPSIVKVRVMGPYHNIEEYIQQIPSEIGQFNYIDNLKLWKSQDFIAKQGMNLGDQHLSKDEKSMIMEFDIIMYHS